ncbi:MAG TPA: hypothetical protein VN874_01950 [Myxococcales bacterium]|jgi:hypothetical protein|nr:hypothetical protein [Myxococcales bacterium]
MRTPLLLAAAAAVALVMISLPARADSFSPCGDGYHWDSYERGIRSAFSSNDADLRPGLNDEACYQAGLGDGPLVSASGDSRCGDNFSSGHADGLNQAQGRSSGTCYDLGYDAGRADLDIGAREANAPLVGDSCVQAYRKGHADYLAGMSSDSTGLNEPQALYCYNLGLYEAPLLPR